MQPTAYRWPTRNQQQNPKSGGMGDETTTPAIRQSQGASSIPIGMDCRPRAKPGCTDIPDYRHSAESQKGLPHNTSPMSPQPFAGYASSERTRTMGRQSTLAPAQKKGTAVNSGREDALAESGGHVYGQYRMTKTMPPSPQQPIYGWHRCRKQP
jgi:hypothetical protein